MVLLLQSQVHPSQEQVAEAAVAEVAAADQVVLVVGVQDTLVVQVILLEETQAQSIQAVVEDQMVFL
jgi:hypothetical protein